MVKKLLYTIDLSRSNYSPKLKRSHWEKKSIPPTNCIFENKGMRWIFAEKKYAKLARGNS